MTKIKKGSEIYKWALTDTRSRGFLGVSGHRAKCYRGQMRGGLKKDMEF